MEASTSTPASAPVLLSVAASKNGRTAGKAHKITKTATRRSYLSASVKTPFEIRKENDKKAASIKALEREMKDEKAAETERWVAGWSNGEKAADLVTRKRTALKERRERQAEKSRMEELRAKMSAKKLQRMKKRQGRSKKING
ncbi:rRNA-processing protein CGR1, partial [Tremellales sp. Uapishka_1]